MIIDLTKKFMNQVNNKYKEENTQVIRKNLQKQQDSRVNRVQETLRDLIRVIKYLEIQDIKNIDRLEVSQNIKYFEKEIKSLNFKPQNKQQEQTYNTVILILESKLEKLVRIFRDLEVLKFNEQLEERKQVLDKEQSFKFGNLQDKEQVKQLNLRRYQENKQVTTNQDLFINEDQEMLERENKMLLENYTTNINQIEDTEKIIFELSQILQQFSTKVIEQENMTIMIQQNAEESVQNVIGGNKELDKAKEYQKGNGHIFAGVFILYTITMWLWEYINTRNYY